MSTKDSVALKFSAEIRQNLGPHLKGLTLFGSRARGDAREEPDYDFLILVGERNKKIVRLIRQAEVELLGSERALSDRLIYSEAEWSNRKVLSMGINIQREGIAV